MNVQALRRDIRGAVLARGDETYETVRATSWNRLRPTRRPDAIVRAAGEADVLAAVRFARDEGLRVAVRSGGHSWCSAPLRDGGLLLDLAALDRVDVDPVRRSAVAQPAARVRDLSRLLGRHDLAFPYGHCSSVALGGYLLAGGLGWNTGAWGPACLSVAAIDVVTARGERVAVDHPAHADLLWAARGAGPGFFGVVTGYHLALQAQPKAMSTNTYAFPLARAGEVAAALAEISAELPRTVETTLFLAAPRESPTGEFACLVSATVFADTEREASESLAPLENSRIAASSTAKVERRPTSYDALFDDMDAHFPAEHRTLADTFWSNAPAGEVVGAAAEHFARAPSPRSVLLCVLPPPPDPGAPPPEAAFSMSAAVFVACYATWASADDDDANGRWHAGAVATLERFAVGHYLGESDVAARPGRAPASFSPESWVRLRALRRRHDPAATFHGYFGPED